MFGLSKVLRGVPVLGGVAAANVATSLAEAQLNPRIAHLQALFAIIGAGGWVLNLGEV